MLHIRALSGNLFRLNEGIENNYLFDAESTTILFVAEMKFLKIPTTIALKGKHFCAFTIILLQKI